MASVFLDRLHQFQQQRRSLLCVGLDPEAARLPVHLVQQYGPLEATYHFCRTVAEATEPYVCAYKFNLAFFEASGARGMDVLERLVEELRDKAIIIADAKRGDIGNTARLYAEAAFNWLGADACTVAPYMGRDSVEPFLAFGDRAAFVLARTSNQSSRDFQDLQVDGEPLYRHVARRVAEWDRSARGQAGLVVGATDIAAIGEIRSLCPDLPFLIPGVGAQGGEPSEVLRAGRTREGTIIVNSSRSIIYASSSDDFADAAAGAASELASLLYY
ncbi:MAG: orotidine-5'-phosphate decarboxylase [Rhodothermales bacterium]